MNDQPDDVPIDSDPAEPRKDPLTNEAIRSAGDLIAAAPDLVAAGAEATSAAADVVAGAAEAVAGGVAEGIAGAANGCGSCSCAIVVFIGLLLTASSAIAAMMW
jgi:hypothetical protein